MQNSNYANQQRLDNIKALKPMLASLRTISLSNWKAALKKLRFLDTHIREFNAVIDTIMQKSAEMEFQPDEDTVVVLLGSTRGLCGGFNRDLFAFYEKQFENSSNKPTKPIIFGERLKTLYTQKHHDEPIFLRYPRINLLNYHSVKELLYEISESSPGHKITIIFNEYNGAGKFRPAIQSFNLPTETAAHIKQDKADDIIVDTDIHELSQFINCHNHINSIYRIFLSSLAAEHSTRFQLMESAITNIDNLIQELTIMVQVERRRKVTSEMRELSIGAGLLKQEKSRTN